MKVVQLVDVRDVCCIFRCFLVTVNYGVVFYVVKKWGFWVTREKSGAGYDGGFVELRGHVGFALGYYSSVD